MSSALLFLLLLIGSIAFVVMGARAGGKMSLLLVVLGAALFLVSLFGLVTALL